MVILNFTLLTSITSIETAFKIEYDFILQIFYSTLYVFILLSRITSYV